MRAGAAGCTHVLLGVSGKVLCTGIMEKAITQ